MGSPILGFRFRVDFGIDGFFITDNGFSKISGITMSLILLQIMGLVKLVA